MEDNCGNCIKLEKIGFELLHLSGNLSAHNDFATFTRRKYAKVAGYRSSTFSLINTRPIQNRVVKVGWIKEMEKAPKKTTQKCEEAAAIHRINLHFKIYTHNLLPHIWDINTVASA